MIDKPAGLLAVPTSPEARDEEDTALRRVREYVRRRSPRHPYVGLVHRIDRDTSGAMAFAFSPDARAGLIDAFRDHRIERRYLALVGGVPREGRGSGGRPAARGLRERAARSGAARRARRGPRSRVGGSRSDSRGAALLEVDLKTGRQHQVRMHLAHIGLPVLGDPVYGARDRPPVPVSRQMLHAQHPRLRTPACTGEPVRAMSPLPEDFTQALGRPPQGHLRRTPPGRGVT